MGRRRTVEKIRGPPSPLQGGIALFFLQILSSLRAPSSSLPSPLEVDIPMSLPLLQDLSLLLAASSLRLQATFLPTAL